MSGAALPRAQVVEVDYDSSSQSQRWCRKHHRTPLLMCAAILLIGIAGSSIGIGILVKKSKKQPPTSASASASESDSSSTATIGTDSSTSTNRENEASSSSQDGQIWQEQSSTDTDTDAVLNNTSTSSLVHSPSTSTSTTVEYFQRLRGTDIPTQSPSHFPTYFPTTATSSTSATPTTVNSININNNHNNNDEPLTFYVIGDVPYSDMEACLLPHELGKLSSTDANANGRFLVHLGDIRDGRPRPCTEEMHEHVAGIFESSPVPTFFIIGDNGWLDCGEGTVDESFTYWEKHLLPFHERTDLNWPPLGTDVTRHPRHPELFAFHLDKILFLGQGLPVPQSKNMPPPDEWEDYIEENIKWTRDHIQNHIVGAGVDNNSAVRQDLLLRAVVIFAHNSGGPAAPYYDELKNIASSLIPQIPILFMEDNHWWAETTYQNIPNLYRIALDDTVTATSITIDTTTTETAWSSGSSSSGNNMNIRQVFRYDRGCWCSSGHRPTLLMEYSSGECQGACQSNAQCAGENDCGTDGAGCY